LQCDEAPSQKQHVWASQLAKDKSAGRVGGNETENKDGVGKYGTKEQDLIILNRILICYMFRRKSRRLIRSESSRPGTWPTDTDTDQPTHQP
jgi:hypothetical protein